LDLTGEPLVPAPAHGLPIEYMEGPYRYHGTMRGQPVSGFAFYERSLALYRDWELIEVLASAVDNAESVDELRALVASGNRSQARKVLQSMLAALPTDSEHAQDVINALIEVLSADG
jgi:thioredoxin-like negative regulator of GroEL